ncbi:unnamed protein product [Caenorhabditis sp. 36 PRJEB53466]|nr:unnamed protein product [Caenorhabditis sp. 36 PRJEB53466]
MAPRKKKSRLTTKKAKQSAVDNTFYEVEGILGCRPLNNQLLYKVAWLGFSEADDTEEAENRLNCDKELVIFAKKLIDSDTYIDTIDDDLLLVPDAKYSNILLRIDPLSISIQTTIHTGTVKFACKDTVNSKRMLLEYVRECNQQYQLHSFHVPAQKVIDKSFQRYSEELRYLFDIFDTYPFVQVKMPYELENTFYAPPPLPKLLLEPYLPGQGDASPHLFPPKSFDLGFNNVTPFIDRCFFETDANGQYPRYYAQQKKRKVPEERFGANFELRQESPRGWILRGAHIIDEETPLMQMAGVIVPVEEAHRALLRYGERVAFSSFINIPGTDYALDRREFHDFSKYIPHSCNPTCAVRLVASGTTIPDLVVYALRVQGLVKRFFERKGCSDGKIFKLYEKNIDFVQCLCNHSHCRQVLYVDQSLDREDKTKTKKETLKNLDPKFKFHGMQLVESTQIHTISDYEFD